MKQRDRERLSRVILNLCKFSEDYCFDVYIGPFYAIKGSNDSLAICITAYNGMAPFLSTCNSQLALGRRCIWVNDPFVVVSSACCGTAVFFVVVFSACCIS